MEKQKPIKEKPKTPENIIARNKPPINPPVTSVIALLCCLKNSVEATMPTPIKISK